MGNIVNPITLRLGYSKQWTDSWFQKSVYYPRVLNSFFKLKLFLIYVLDARWLKYSDYYYSHSVFQLKGSFLVIYLHFYDSYRYWWGRKFLRRIFFKYYLRRFFFKFRKLRRTLLLKNKNVLKFMGFLHFFAVNEPKSSFYFNKDDNLSGFVFSNKFRLLFFFKKLINMHKLYKLSYVFKEKVLGKQRAITRGVGILPRKFWQFFNYYLAHSNVYGRGNNLLKRLKKNQKLKKKVKFIKSFNKFLSKKNNLIIFFLLKLSITFFKEYGLNFGFKLKEHLFKFESFILSKKLRLKRIRIKYIKARRRQLKNVFFSIKYFKFYTFWYKNFIKFLKDKIKLYNNENYLDKFNVLSNFYGYSDYVKRYFNLRMRYSKNIMLNSSKNTLKFGNIFSESEKVPFYDGSVFFSYERYKLDFFMNYIFGKGILKRRLFLLKKRPEFSRSLIRISIVLYKYKLYCRLNVMEVLDRYKRVYLMLLKTFDNLKQYLNIESNRFKFLDLVLLLKEFNSNVQQSNYSKKTEGRLKLNIKIWEWVNKKINVVYSIIMQYLLKLKMYLYEKIGLCFYLNRLIKYNMKRFSVYFFFIFFLKIFKFFFDLNFKEIYKKRYINIILMFLCKIQIDSSFFNCMRLKFIEFIYYKVGIKSKIFFFIHENDSNNGAFVAKLFTRMWRSGTPHWELMRPFKLDFLARLEKSVLYDNFDDFYDYSQFYNIRSFYKSFLYKNFKSIFKKFFNISRLLFKFIFNIKLFFKYSNFNINVFIKFKKFKFFKFLYYKKDYYLKFKNFVFVYFYNRIFNYKIFIKNIWIYNNIFYNYLGSNYKFSNMNNVSFDYKKRNFAYFLNKVKHYDYWIKGTFIRGYKFHFSGRFKKKQRKSSVWLKEGRLGLSDVNTNIDYGCHMHTTVHSRCNLKVWLYKTDLMVDYLIQIL